MSRNIKDGLLFFSVDTDLFQNRKVKVLKAYFGADGITIYLYILCSIYDNGYFLGIDEDFKYIIGDELNIDREKSGKVLEFLIERDFFDKEIYTKYSVLTSVNIQKRYQNAVKERVKKKPRAVGKYWLLSKSETVANLIIPDHSQEESDCSQDNEGRIPIVPEKNDTDNININNNSIINNNINIKKEKENNKEKSLGLVVDFYKKYLGDIKQEETERISELLEHFEDKLIMECILIAAQKGVKKLSYIIGILKNLDKSGISTLEQYERSKRNDTFTGANEKHNEQHTEEYGTTV